VALPWFIKINLGIAQEDNILNKRTKTKRKEQAVVILLASLLAVFSTACVFLISSIRELDSHAITQTTTAETTAETTKPEKRASALKKPEVASIASGTTTPETTTESGTTTPRVKLEDTTKLETTTPEVKMETTTIFETKPEPTTLPEPETTTFPEPEPEYEYYEEEYEFDSYELELLTRLIYWESGDQEDACQRAVGTVVMNRVNSSEFPNTIEGVVFQSGQYSCTWEFEFWGEPWDYGDFERAHENAKWVLNGGRQLDSDYLYQAMDEQEGTYDNVWIGTECFGRG